jgi:hypothetical protein
MSFVVWFIFEELSKSESIPQNTKCYEEWYYAILWKVPDFFEEQNVLDILGDRSWCPLSRLLAHKIYRLIKASEEIDTYNSPLFQKIPWKLLKNEEKLLWAKIENSAHMSIFSVRRSDSIELKISGNSNLTTTCNIFCDAYLLSASNFLRDLLLIIWAKYSTVFLQCRKIGQLMSFLSKDETNLG